MAMLGSIRSRHASLSSAPRRKWVPFTNRISTGVRLGHRIFAQDPTPEDHNVEVPGGANDSLSSNTELGKAVRSATDELEHLGNMEAEVLDEAFDILKSFGIKVQKPSDFKKENEKESK